jgi:hypothetical protein
MDPYSKYVLSYAVRGEQTISPVLRMCNHSKRPLSLPIYLFPLIIMFYEITMHLSAFFIGCYTIFSRREKATRNRKTQA